MSQKTGKVISRPGADPSRLTQVLVWVDHPVMIDPTSFDARRARLLEEIEAAIEQGKSASRPVELDPSSVGRLSRMDALQNQAMSVEAQRRRDVARARIISALGRLDEGVYGECVVCGEEIAERRLDHDPAAPTCLNCA